MTQTKNNVLQKVREKAVSLFCTIIFFCFLSLYFIIVVILEFLSKPWQKKLTLSTQEKKLNGISIIIPTWNKKEMIIRCLQLLDRVLIKEVKIPVEIIVIENGSSDGSLIVLQNLDLKTPLIILAQEKNLGFAPAINLAVNQAKYNYLYLMNNDMEAQTGTFSNLISYASQLLESGITFFGIASQIFFFDPSKKREESGKNYTRINFGFLKVAHFTDNICLQENSLTLYPGGGSSLINKTIFQKIGGYDHRSYKPLYCEDLDAGFIAWNFGFPSFFCSKSTIIHHHRSSTNTLSFDPNFLISKNFLAFLWKNLQAPNDILRHLLLYPLMMIRSGHFRNYFVLLLFNLPAIFSQRIKLLGYKKIYSQKQLLDFISFENNFYDKT